MVHIGDVLEQDGIEIGSLEKNQESTGIMDELNLHDNDVWLYESFLYWKNT